METMILAAPVVTFALLALLDLVAPARRFPQVRLWRTKGVLFFFVSSAVSVAAPLALAKVLPTGPLVDLSGVGLLAGSILALLAYQLATYLWHRAMHAVPLFWRSHQLHHSAERVDIYGSMVFHPMDLVTYSATIALMMGGVFGFPTEAVLIAGGISSVLNLVQHANVRTPAWLGFLVQRPENHALHHERGIHAFNYGDIPIWDIVFRTFRNPAKWEGRAGFYDGASSRLGEMLVGRLVDEPPAPVESVVQGARARG